MSREKIKDYCNSIGLDTVGFVKCRQFTELREFYQKRKELSLENEFEEKDISKRINPNIYMEEGKTIISIAFPYLCSEEKNNNGFSLYTKGLDYHRVVKEYLNKVCEYIRELGGNAMPFVDSNALPERYIAYLAGIGTIGKNNMIITKKYGSYVFLGEIITDLEIFNDDYGDFEEVNKYKICGDCIGCIKDCPTKAINIARKNPNICSSYITQKKELDKVDFELIKNKIFGCDICQSACPLNSGVSYSEIEQFTPMEFMCENDSQVYAGMNNTFFKEKLARTSCGWRGKNIIKRNAIIKIFNEGKPIDSYKGDSPYINTYISRLENGNEI